MYTNFTGISWVDRKDKWNDKLISMIELSSPITNSITNNLMLIQLVFHGYSPTKPEELKYKYWDQINERPGLQRITYVAKHD